MRIFNHSTVTPNAPAESASTPSKSASQESSVGLSSRSSKTRSAPRQAFSTLGKKLAELKEDAKDFKQYIKSGDKESQKATAALKQGMAAPFKKAGEKMSELKQDARAFGQYIRHGDKKSQEATSALKQSVTAPFHQLKDDAKAFGHYILTGDTKPQEAPTIHVGPAPDRQPRRNKLT
jgi:hypothetical protein